MKEGLFIVLYGINNLGKTTQAELLVENLNKAGMSAQYLKYPIYDLKPTGPKINEILRGQDGQNISEEEFQALYAKNRLDYQPQLIKMIAEGATVVAEDYIGTGLAWGVAKGANLDLLLVLNKGLLKPDVEILLDGDRFLEAKEKGHLHEDNDKFMDACRDVHLQLAARFGWGIVDANQEIEKVNMDILELIAKKLKEID